MFRFIQNIQPQKLLVDKFLHSVQWDPKPPTPAKIIDVTSSERFAFDGKDFEGENVVITSGAGALGRNLALKLGQLKATVAIWDSNKEALDKTSQLVKVIGGRAFTYICDLTRKEDIYRTAEKTRRDIGQVTILINNADVAAEQLFLDTPDYLIERVFNTNVLSHFWTTKAFLPNMIDSNKGHIVSISSMAGLMGIQKLTDYCASKAAAVGFLSALKTELEREGSSGVKTTIICPYFIKSTDPSKDAILRIVPLLNPDEVADRVIKAIRNQESVVFIPGWFKLAMLPKWILPQTITSLILKLLVKDPSPYATPNPVQNSPLKVVQFIRPAESIEYKRNEFTGKNSTMFNKSDEKKEQRKV